MTARLCVVVPAADEEATIGACLDSISAAADVLARTTAAHAQIVVVLDGCTDGTAAIVDTFPDVTALTSGHRNVGRVRGLGAAHALPRLADDDLLVSTDADSVVAPNWLARLHELAATADLVLGTVIPDVGLPIDIEREWYQRHDLRDGHPHVHGANLAIRAGAYRALGGWAPLASGEDADLAARAVAAGLRVRRTALVPVLTSTRATGRTPHGFSSYLRELGHRTAEATPA